jgi:hypothetical protein
VGASKKFKLPVKHTGRALPLAVVKPSNSERERDLTSMPTELPVLPDDQYSLPEFVGTMFDSTVLAGDRYYVWWRILGVDTHWTGCTVQAELCAHCVTLPKEPELLRGRRLHWRREMLMNGS